MGKKPMLISELEETQQELKLEKELKPEELILTLKKKLLKMKLEPWKELEEKKQKELLEPWKKLEEELKLKQEKEELKQKEDLKQKKKELKKEEDFLIWSDLLLLEPKDK